MDLTNDPKVQEAYSMTDYLYLDIETLPCDDPAFRENVLAGIKAPGNYTKPESIADWMEKNRESAADEIIAKTSFDGGRGSVCCVAWAWNGGRVNEAHVSDVHQLDEAFVVTDLMANFGNYKSITPVGHNLIGFDLPFLLKRAIILGVPIGRQFPRNPKPWDKGVHDTMLMWDAKNFTSLDTLCEIMGIPGKGDFDGSMVAAAWAAGEREKVAEYCADDVRRVRAVHQRFLAAGW